MVKSFLSAGNPLTQKMRAAGNPLTQKMRASTPPRYAKTRVGSDRRVVEAWACMGWILAWANRYRLTANG